VSFQPQVIVEYCRVASQLSCIWYNNARYEKKAAAEMMFSFSVRNPRIFLRSVILIFCVVRSMKNKLFVGSLSWDTTEESLKEFFAQVGTVVEAVIIFDKFTNRSKGFGFVTMSTEEEAQEAIEKLNDAELDGRQIKVSVARPPKQSFDR